MRLIQRGCLVPNLITLCRKYGIDAPDDVLPLELSSQLQQKWLREGYLRYQIKGEPPSNEDYDLLHELGFIDEVRPKPTGWANYNPFTNPERAVREYHYSGVLLLGVLLPRVISQLHYLTNIAYSINFHEEWRVYLFGGARPLDPVKESRKALCTPKELPFKRGWTAPEQMPTTEAEMMEFVWQQFQLPEWKYELVNTSLRPKDPKNPDGEKRSPNTGDTMREWVTKCRPLSGYYLALSNQPFVEYQELALQRLAPYRITIYACGPESSLTLPLATYLDNIAKQLYEELQVG